MIRLLFSFGRYLLELLENLSKGLNARLYLKQMNADAQNKLAALHIQSIKDLKSKCKQVSSVFNSPIIVQNYYLEKERRLNLHSFLYFQRL